MHYNISEQIGGEIIRKIITKKSAKAKGKVEPDDYLTRLIKYIPSETVVLYITLYGIASSASTEIPFEQIVWVVFIVGAILTPVYMWRIAKVTDWVHILISTGAFVIWIFALGGPFAYLPWYHSAYGALILPIYTAVIPLFEQ